MEPIKLDIGAGATLEAGWTSWDIKDGRDARRIDLADGSVEEIRAVHILEHLANREIVPTLREWNRVLRPGGRLFVAVPFVEEIARSILARVEDPNLLRYLMGGQIDEDDFHRTAFTSDLLRLCLIDAGFVRICRVGPEGENCSRHPYSLNFSAAKPEPNTVNLERRSQMLQEFFALGCVNYKANGTFVDIGAGEPETISNTVEMERKLYWSGILCDIETRDRLRAERGAAGNIVVGDFFEQDWPHLLRQVARCGRIDFLSFDLEPPNLTIAALREFPLDAVRFSVICFEHDSYRNGPDDVRAESRRIFEKAGYLLIAPDVEIYTGAAFEDWWIDPTKIAPDHARKILAELPLRELACHNLAQMEAKANG